VAEAEGFAGVGVWVEADDAGERRRERLDDGSSRAGWVRWGSAAWVGAGGSPMVSHAVAARVTCHAQEPTFGPPFRQEDCRLRDKTRVTKTGAALCEPTECRPLRGECGGHRSALPLKWHGRRPPPMRPAQMQTAATPVLPFRVRAIVLRQGPDPCRPDCGPSWANGANRTGPGVVMHASASDLSPPRAGFSCPQRASPSPAIRES
jgi:hypothetical protein